MLANTLAVHHSVSSLSTTVEDIDQWHKDRGWDGIGYHWVIEGDGELKVGRPFTKQGAHVSGHNDHCWGICLVGDNTKAGREWTDEQLLTLKLFIALLGWAMPSIQVKTHNEISSSSECPGMSGDELRARLEAV